MSALMRWVDDAINPIVIKELRQAIHGKFAAILLTLFLATSVVALTITLLSVGSDNVGSQAGRALLMVLQVVLVATCVLLLPIYTAVRLAGERSDANTDLMFITTIRPRSIIWGKFVAGMVLAVLMYSACMPFMTLTYLLRGVDLPSVVVLLALGFTQVMVAVQLAILSACLTVSRALRVLIGLVLLFLLGSILWSVSAGSAGIVFFGGSFLMDDDFWAVAGVYTGLTFCGLWLMYTFSVALITPTSANRMLPVRVVMTIVWLISAVVFWGLGLWVTDSEPIEFWVYASVTTFAGAMLMAVSERDAWGVRVARTIPRNPLLRIPAFIFYSGAGGGLVWAWLIIGATLASVLIPTVFMKPLLEAVFPALRSFDEEVFAIAIGLALFFYAYAMAGLLVRRWILGRDFQHATWVLGLVVAGLCVILPMILTVLVVGDEWFRHEETAMILNPVALDDRSMRPTALFIAGLAAALLTAVNLPWFFNQIANFRPPNRNDEQ